MTDTASNWLPWGIPVIIIGILLLIVIIFMVIRWYVQRPIQYTGTARIDGKTVVITGGNTGIGKETAKDLLKRGGKIIILCRDTQKAKVAAEEMNEEGGSPVGIHQLDLTSLDSIRECAKILKEKEPKIDILINNAGVMATPKLQTKDGFEMQLGTNHLGHFLLTLLLIDNVKAAAPARIVNVSSLAHTPGRMHWDDLHMKNNYDSIKAYAQSKLANILFTKILAEKLKGTGVTTYALHPGLVNTELSRHMPDSLGGFLTWVFDRMTKVIGKTPKMGAQTSVFCAVDEGIAKESGKYYSGCKKKTPTRRARNMEDAERLWEESLKMVGLDQDFTF